MTALNERQAEWLLAMDGVRAVIAAAAHTSAMGQGSKHHSCHQGQADQIENAVHGRSADASRRRLVQPAEGPHEQ